MIFFSNLLQGVLIPYPEYPEGRYCWIVFLVHETYMFSMYNANMFYGDWVGLYQFVNEFIQLASILSFIKITQTSFHAFTITLKLIYGLHLQSNDLKEGVEEVQVKNLLFLSFQRSTREEDTRVPWLCAGRQASSQKATEEDHGSIPKGHRFDVNVRIIQVKCSVASGFFHLAFVMLWANLKMTILVHRETILYRTMGKIIPDFCQRLWIIFKFQTILTCLLITSYRATAYRVTFYSTIDKVSANT